jgi:hypothetical protein
MQHRRDEVGMLVERATVEGLRLVDAALQSPELRQEREGEVRAGADGGGVVTRCVASKTRSVWSGNAARPSAVAAAAAAVSPASRRARTRREARSGTYGIPCQPSSSRTSFQAWSR